MGLSSHSGQRPPLELFKDIFTLYLVYLTFLCLFSNTPWGLLIEWSSRQTSSFLPLLPTHHLHLKGEKVGCDNTSYVFDHPSKKDLAWHVWKDMSGITCSQDMGKFYAKQFSSLGKHYPHPSNYSELPSCFRPLKCEDKSLDSFPLGI